MKVKELMGPGPILTAREDDDLALALQIMLWARVRHLPVVRDGTVVGVLSERDVLRYEARHGIREGSRASVREAMSEPAEVIGPEEDASDASERMLDQHLGCLPVVDGGRLLGIVTTTDVLGYHARRRLPAVHERGVARVTDVMTRETEVVHEDDDLIDAVERMARKGIRHLPVVDAESRVIGIVSDRDVRAAVGDPLQLRAGEEMATVRIGSMKVSHVMTAPPFLVSADESLPAAVRHFLDWRVGALPVVDDDERLVGIVSYVDVLAALYQYFHEVPAPQPHEAGGTAPVP